MSTLRGSWMAAPGGDWERGRSKAKVQKCHQIWIAVGLISHCIILSSEIHLTELENTHANTLKDLGSLHSDQAMVSHWLLVGTIVFLLSYVSEGSSAPFDCWDATIPTSISYPMSVTFFYQLFQLSFLCSCFPVQVQRIFCAVKRPTAQPKDVRKTASTRTHNISSFPSPLNNLCAPLRTRDRSVEKSWWVWPDKAKEICLSKSYVGKSSLAHGLMIITNSFTAKPEATQFLFFC